MLPSRVFVCDPRCVEPYGADVDALKYFSVPLKQHFDQVVAVCCRFLPEDIATSNGFVPHFDFYYDAFLKIRRPDGARSPLFRETSLDFVDGIEAVATADAEDLLAKFDIGERDAIFFPSIDFYGALGLLNALIRSEGKRRPKVLMRFIGVSEYGTKGYRQPLSVIAGRIAQARAAGAQLLFSAETPKYADLLSETFDADVTVTPYIDAAEASPMRKFGPFVFVCPGSARHDKGFFRLAEIMRKVRLRDPDLTVRLVTQSLPDRDAVHHQSYISQLYAIPGVEVLPSWISETEILQLYRDCNAVLLPYDVNTYINRGSAVMMLAACFGRPNLTLQGTAFAQQVSYFNLGYVVPGIDEMVEAMLAMAREPRESLERRALQGRRRFLRDSLGAYRSWFQSAGT
jgi:glycosyltransferase involved in cell wall biosynthesis